MGGTVYRGSRFISLQGIYFYADFCSGRIWGLRRIGNSWQSGVLYYAPFRISSIGEDEDGNLYVSNYSNGLILAWRGGSKHPAATPASTPAATAHRPDASDLTMAGNCSSIGDALPVTSCRRSPRPSALRGRPWTASAILRNGL